MDHEAPNDVPHPHGPASFLLPEILEEIFFLAQSGPNLPQNELLYSPFNVSQVSQHWRKVAHGRKGLWNIIKAVTNSNSVMCHAKRLILVELFLSRCGSILPLDISIYTNPFSNGSATTSRRRRAAASSMCQYINLVKPVRHRWRDIHLDFKIASPAKLFPGAWPWVFDNMPMLEKLQITYPNVRNKKETGTIDLSASRRLKACYVVGCVRMNIAEEITLPNLKYLGFEVARKRDEGLVANWLRVLGRAPNLLRLTVIIRPGLKWRNSGHITLPSLQYLNIVYTEEVENDEDELQFAFLNGLLCPELKELSFVCIYSKGPRQRDGFNIQIEHSGPSSFLKASGCSLERLHIEYDLFDEYELERTLALCPDLQTLRFRDMRFAEDSELLDTFHLERVIGEGEMFNGQEFVLLCPKLKALIVDRCYIPPCITTTRIADMLACNWMCEGSELVHFSFTDCGLEGFDQHPWIQEMRGSTRFVEA